MTSHNSIPNEYNVGDVISFLDITECVNGYKTVVGLVLKVSMIKSDFIYSECNNKQEAIRINPEKSNFQYTVMSNQGTFFLFSGDSKTLNYHLLSRI